MDTLNANLLIDHPGSSLPAIFQHSGYQGSRDSHHWVVLEDPQLLYHSRWPAIMVWPASHQESGKKCSSSAHFHSHPSSSCDCQPSLSLFHSHFLSLSHAHSTNTALYFARILSRSLSLTTVQSDISCPRIWQVFTWIQLDELVDRYSHGSSLPVTSI